MDRALLGLLAGRREENRGDHTLRILTAQELLSARAEARELPGDRETEGLLTGACILARAVIENGMRVFSGGEAVLKSWSAEKITEEMAAYRALARQVDPSCRQQEAVEHLMEQLRGEPMERIRWRVLRAFSALPTEQRVRDMTEGDYLYCASQLLLDRQERLDKLCPACRKTAEKECCPGCGRPLSCETGGNPNFDEKRFEELRRHG